MDDIKGYFENKTGLGVLATADGDGLVDTAVYARPHVTADDRLSFIMADRLSHANVLANPHASYLFVEEGPGYRGKRLYLTKIGEDTDREVIDSLRRRSGRDACSRSDGKLFLVHFRIDRVLPLVGDDGQGI